MIYNHSNHIVTMVVWTGKPHFLKEMFSHLWSWSCTCTWLLCSHQVAALTSYGLYKLDVCLWYAIWSPADSCKWKVLPPGGGAASCGIVMWNSCIFSCLWMSIPNDGCALSMVTHMYIIYPTVVVHALEFSGLFSCGVLLHGEVTGTSDHNRISGVSCLLNLTSV